MKLADICIERPVFATMLVGALVVIGLFSYFELGVDLFPRVEFTTVVVRVALPGASPEEVESQVTKVIEEAINTINGIETLRSISSEGLSLTVVQFELERSVDQAAQDVRDKVATIVANLPRDAEAPVIEKIDPHAAPILTLVVSGDRDLREVTEITEEQIKEQIESVQGVGSIALLGARRREINLEVDPVKLNAYGLPIDAVRQAVAGQNVEVPGGRLETAVSEIALRTTARLGRVEDFEAIVVADINGRTIRLGDIGRAVDGIREVRSLSRLDGKPAIALEVRKQSGANSIEVIDAVKERLPQIHALIPADVNIQIVRDQSEFIQGSIHEVTKHLFLGGVFAGLVVLVFMWSVRSMLIAGLAIPISLISTFAFMRFMGFTLNIMTLLGLTLAIGIVIDDAIVVLENIYRYIEEKKYPSKEAAHKATAEIGLAVMATTLSLVVIFVPIAFLGGIPGRFLHSFGLTIAVAILVSLFVAFTLTPMLCSVLFRGAHERKPRKESREGWVYSKIDRGYGRALRWSLAHRGWIVILSIAVFLSSAVLIRFIGLAFIPEDDTGEFEIVIKTPPGYTLERTDALLREIEDQVRKLPAVRHILASIGSQGGESVRNASLFVKMPPVNERPAGLKQSDNMTRARRIMAQYPELRPAVQLVSAFRVSGFRQAQVQLNVRGPELDRLERYSQQMIAQMKQMEGLVDIDSTYEGGNPEVQLRIDRDKAADLGVSIDRLAFNLRTLVAGERVGIFREGDDQYEVRLRLLPEYRSDARDVLQLQIGARDGRLVRLDNFVKAVEGIGPAQIDRQARQRQITLLANLSPGYALGDAVNQIEASIPGLDLAPGYQTDFEGFAKILADLVVDFVKALLLSVIFMYIILAAQFESFVHPVTILLSLPLTIPFALLSLLVTGQTLNLYSALGLFLLFGVVKKNSILQVDHTNTLRAQGLSRYDAIIRSNHDRLRPILMTTITLVAGMIPLALGTGPGAASRRSIAIVIIGGQSLCLLLTLLITPVGYTYFDDLAEKRLLHRVGRLLRRKPVAVLGE